MNEFKKRERAQEAKFILDQDLQFKALAQSHKLLGLWAGDLLRLTTTEIEAYALELVQYGSQKEGREEVFAKIRTDFDAQNIPQTDQKIRRVMDEFLAKTMSKLA